MVRTKEWPSNAFDRTSRHGADVTGGMATKLAAAASIARYGTPVYIVKGGTEASLAALGKKRPLVGTYVHRAGTTADEED